MPSTFKATSLRVEIKNKVRCHEICHYIALSLLTALISPSHCLLLSRTIWSADGFGALVWAGLVRVEHKQTKTKRADNKGRADVRPEEAPKVGQQGGASCPVLSLLLLLVPREVHKVHQQERLHSGTV